MSRARFLPLPWLLLALPLATALTLLGCSRDEDAHDHDDAHGEEPEGATHEDKGAVHEEADHAGDEAGHGEDQEVRVPLADLRGLAFAQVGEPQEEGVWAPAEAVSDADSVAIVTAPASGIVRRLLVRTGESVRAGAPVAELASAEIADLAARHRTARAEEERARIAVERERALFAANATSRREVEAAEAAVIAAHRRGRGGAPVARGARGLA